jgi:hypothetical protein
MNDYRAIVNYFLGQVEWREQKAIEYPDDSRNAQSGACLRSLAAYVLGRTDGDEVLRELATLTVHEGMFTPFAEGAWLISRFGYDFSTEDHAGFLARLMTVTRREAIAFVREHGALTDDD